MEVKAHLCIILGHLAQDAADGLHLLQGHVRTSLYSVYEAAHLLPSHIDQWLPTVRKQVEGGGQDAISRRACKADREGG